MQQATKWSELPTFPLLGDTLIRSGFRSDGALLTFNAIKPDMKRWEPHSHPFDQIVVILEGSMMLEVEGQAMEMGPRTIARVPGDKMHTGWPIGGKPVLNIDIFAPPRPDYLFLTKHQTEFAPVEPPKVQFNQELSEKEFTGPVLKNTKGLVYKWDELPTAEMLDGEMIRSGFRSDGCLMVFNRLKPNMRRLEPHTHPFDQIVMIVEGSMALEIEGKVIECGPGSVTRVPPGVPHTGWPLHGKPALNIDIFAPPRADYLSIVDYQPGFGKA